MTYFETQTLLPDTIEVADGPEATSTPAVSNDLAAMTFATCLEHFVRSAGNAIQPLDFARFAPTVWVAASRFEQAFDSVKATSSAIRALERLRTFSTWKANWDAEGAPTPDKDAIEAASNLLGYLKNYNIEPTAMLDSLGKPLFLFSHGASDAEISVLSRNMIEFLFVDGETDRAVEVDVQFDGVGMPPELESALEGLSRKA